jgi:class 3 adenylate cyclase
MGLSDDLRVEVKDIFRSKWEFRDGLVVPGNEDLKLTNDGVKIDAVVVYSDLADSTEMVDTKTPGFSAEVYKAFLRCACKIITGLDGTVTAFDGDRVMGVFVGGSKNTNAVKAALRINWAVNRIVNPALKETYATSDYVVKQGTGVDAGELLVARTGIRGSNDLVWVGPAANYAAKLSALRKEGFSTWISKKVFDSANKDAKYDDKGNLMWESRTWNTYNQTVYGTNYWWGF